MAPGHTRLSMTPTPMNNASPARQKYEKELLLEGGRGVAAEMTIVRETPMLVPMRKASPQAVREKESTPGV